MLRVSDDPRICDGRPGITSGCKRDHLQLPDEATRLSANTIANKSALRVYISCYGCQTRRRPAPNSYTVGCPKCDDREGTTTSSGGSGISTSTPGSSDRRLQMGTVVRPPHGFVLCVLFVSVGHYTPFVD